MCSRAARQPGTQKQGHCHISVLNERNGLPLIPSCVYFGVQVAELLLQRLDVRLLAGSKRASSGGNKPLKGFKLYHTRVYQPYLR